MKNKALSVILLLVLGCLWISPVTAAEGREWHGGFQSHAVIVQPYWGWGPGWGWRPGWGWGTYWGGYYPPSYYPIDYRGKIKISDPNKSDQVYIDGALAGTVRETSSFRLKPGQYEIQIRQNGKTLLAQQVYVISGKTVKIKVD